MLVCSREFAARRGTCSLTGKMLRNAGNEKEVILRQRIKMFWKWNLEVL